VQQSTCGRLGASSACILGGGGTGQVGGRTPREEGAAPVPEAVQAGIPCFDVAPSDGHGEAQWVIGEAVGGRLPAGGQVSTMGRCSFTTRESLMLWPTVTLESPVPLQRRRSTGTTRR
jgi:aryl-alcohol dehydrogenase-like predicted oxidoreductase